MVPPSVRGSRSFVFLRFTPSVRISNSTSSNKEKKSLLGLMKFEYVKMYEYYQYKTK